MGRANHPDIFFRLQHKLQCHYILFFFLFSFSVPPLSLHSFPFYFINMSKDLESCVTHSRYPEGSKQAKYSICCLNSWNFCLLLVLRDNSANFTFCLYCLSCSVIYNQINESEMWAYIIAAVFIGFKVDAFINTAKIQSIQKSKEDAFFWKGKNRIPPICQIIQNYYNQSRGIWIVFN